jgi:voltage-dependent potassium channel beta subunit
VREIMAAAYDAGVNFFDNAEVYAHGKSEEIMGAVFRELGWPRIRYVVSTKFYWGFRTGANDNNTLNRKYLLHAIDGSLARLQLDFVDLVYCHRADPTTPIEETVWAMHDIVASGRALYWGTSEWSAADIRTAWDIADRRNLHKPVVEQPEYNVFHRKRVEHEYARLYDDIGLGLTTWSPLASGLLTGKYRQGVPPGSRATLPNYAFLRDSLTDRAKNDIVGRLEDVARDLGCTLAQLALAWCLKNPRVSSVITGATRIEQVKENMAAIEVAAKLDREQLARIDAIVGPTER